jgi:tRNA pseudouridine38-40 synthase
VEEVHAEFHARKAALAKTYCYRIYRGEICPPFLARYRCHHPYPLREEPMIAAAGSVIGEHDFTSFAAVDPEARKEGLETNNVRTILSSEWKREGEELIYTVRGNGFLHHMVRNLVGTFLMIGKGSLSPADVPRILAQRDRSAAAATAPASGLYLVSVEY